MNSKTIEDEKDEKDSVLLDEQKKEHTFVKNDDKKYD